jgi:hypothetical protein
LIIRMPPEKRERLKQVAKSRNVSVNKLIDEMATLAITEHDAETCCAPTRHSRWRNYFPSPYSAS